MTDPAPTVYLEDGTPVKVRVLGADCEGDVSGDGHFGYQPREPEADRPTVYFETANEATMKRVVCPWCYGVFEGHDDFTAHFPDAHPIVTALNRILPIFNVPSDGH